MESLGDVLKRLGPIERTGAAAAEEEDVCPICRGAGYLRYDVNPEDERFGELVVCDCTREELEGRRLRRLVEKSNLASLGHLTFDTFLRKYRGSAPPKGTPEAAYEVARTFAGDPHAFKPQRWLVFYGSFGTGKTHLAVAIANHRIQMGEPAIFIVVPDLLDHLRATFSPSSDTTYDELFESVRNTPLLILDDLGTQTTTPWAQEKLYQLINDRYNKALPTVITTNMEPDDIEPRLRSRIFDSYLSRVCEMRGVDYRLGVAHQKPAAPEGSRRPLRRVRDERI